MRIISVYGGNHGSSVTVLSDGLIQQYLKNDRYTNIKNDPGYLNVYSRAISEYGHSADWFILQTPDKSKTNLSNVIGDLQEHHLYHASSAFYCSGFEKSLVVVIDTSGETVYIAEYPDKFTPIYINKTENNNIEGICQLYNTSTKFLGISNFDTDVVMDASLYGDQCLNFVNYFTSTEYPTRVDPESLKKNYSVKFTNINNKTYTINKSNYLHYCNYFKEIQIQTQDAVKNLVDKVTKETGIMNVCLTGGYAKNTHSNFNLLKCLSNINFFFDPICDNNGISIGAALYHYRNLTKETWINPLETTAICGTSPLLWKNSNKKNVEDVANALNFDQVVGVYTGISEIDRTNGNRCILVNATREYSSKIMLSVRYEDESLWYKSFNVVVLEEDFDRYFYTENITKCPFGNVSFPIKTAEIFPSCSTKICRVQTISKNHVLYDILDNYKKISGHGVLMIDNMIGDAGILIETVEQLFTYCYGHSIDYLWIPENQALFTSKEICDTLNKIAKNNKK